MTCGELKSAEKQTDDITSAALFGVTGNPYTICPGCMQETPMDVRNDPEFRRMARVTLYTKFGLVVRE